MKGGNFISTLLRFGRIEIIDALVFSNWAYRGAYRTFQVDLQSIEGRTNGSGEVWNRCQDAQQSAIEERTKWPHRDMLHQRMSQWEYGNLLA
jgi:hypothetical protein